VLGSGCFPDAVGFTPPVGITAGCRSERGGRVEDVHRPEQHPSMLAEARGGERLCRVPCPASLPRSGLSTWQREPGQNCDLSMGFLGFGFVVFF